MNKQMYFTAQQHLFELMDNLTSDDPKIKKRLRKPLSFKYESGRMRVNLPLIGILGIRIETNWFDSNLLMISFDISGNVYSEIAAISIEQALKVMIDQITTRITNVSRYRDSYIS